jgi:hypothetical protein
MQKLTHAALWFSKFIFFQHYVLFVSLTTTRRQYLDTGMHRIAKMKTWLFEKR